MTDVTMEEDLGKKTILAYRIKTYFMYGHSNWTGMFISLLTFIFVVYDYILLHTAGMLSFLPEWFFLPWIFIHVAMIAYVIPVTLIGWASYHKGEVAIRMGMDWKYNPSYQKLMQKLEHIESLLEEIKNASEGIH